MMRRWGTRIRGRGWSPMVILAYAGMVGLFLWTLAQFYIPGKGFSYLIAFGGTQETQRLSKVRRLDYYVEKASDGYDAQYYVQIAMDPSLQNRELRKAVDSLSYRARRILFSATAYGFGLGRPEWILQAYALQNPAAWLLLAALLLHWFPPRDWGCFLRWAGVLFSFGMCVSVRNALIDGPSLLLVTLGVLLLERGRPWLSVLAFGFGGLGKETNLLGAASLLPRWPAGRRDWLMAVLRGLLVGLPLLLWLVYLARVVGPVANAGYRNFDWPFAAYGRKWMEASADLPDVSWPNLGAIWSILMLVALTVQFLGLVLRPRWNEAWWRVGATYALLMVFLGDAVWEGYPGAASRVLLPMQVAFNVLVPVGRGWMAVLVLGNLTLLTAPVTLQSPAGGGFVLRGPAELLNASGGRKVSIEYDKTWYSPEQNGGDYWCWGQGNGSVLVNNPHDRVLLARIRFTLVAADRRAIQLLHNGPEIWSTTLTGRDQVSVTLNGVELLPGENRFDFQTDTPPGKIGSDPRLLAIRLGNLRIDVRQFAEQEILP